LRVPAPQAAPITADSIAAARPAFLDRIADFLSLAPALLVRSLLTFAVIWGAAWVALRLLGLQDVDLDRTLEEFRDEAARFYDDKAWHFRFEGAPEVPGVEQITDTRVLIRTMLRTVAGAQGDVAREFRRRIRHRLAAESKREQATKRDERI
jgi:hypothetical protein